MTVGSALPARRGALRIADQALWSVSFFVINLVAALTLGTDQFATYSTCLAIALVAVAVNRASSIDSQLIDGARRGAKTHDSFFYASTTGRSWTVAAVATGLASISKTPTS